MTRLSQTESPPSRTDSQPSRTDSQPSRTGSNPLQPGADRLCQDRRLLIPAVAAWTAAYWATARPTSSILVMAAVACGIGLVLAAALVGRRLPGRRRQVRLGHPARWLSGAALAVATVTVVLAAAAAQMMARSSGLLSNWARERVTAELTGVLVNDPVVIRGVRFGGESRVTIRMQTQQVAARGRRVTASSLVLLLAPAGDGVGSWRSLTAGQRVQVRGRLAETAPADEAVALVSVSRPPDRVWPGSWPWRVADRVRAGLRSACHGLSDDSAGLLPSLVVGDTAALPAALRDDLRGAGLTHLTAVSGANVAIVMGSVGWLAAAGGATRRVRLAASGLALFGFVILARPQPSVLRAAVMASIGLAGLASGRRPMGVPVLAAAVVGLLTHNPWLGRSPGFALSVVATAGLLLLAPPWADRLGRWMPRPLAVALAAPVAAQAACGPVLVLLAPTVSLVAVPANLLAEPAVAPATVLGVTAALVSLVWPWAAHRVAGVGSLATDWIALVAHRAAALPLAEVPWFGGLPGALTLAGLTSLIALVVVRGAAHRRRRQTEPGTGGEAEPEPGTVRPVLLVLVAVLAGWLIAAGTALRLPRAGVPAGWQVVLCDVGQGDALVVRSGQDRAVLVDTGPQPALIGRCLRRLGVRHLDLVVVTHLHADHAFGLPGALAGRDVAAVLVSPLQQPQVSADAVRGWVRVAGVTEAQAWAGDGGGLGRDGWVTRWRVLEPRELPRVSGDVDGDDGSAVNESSVVLLIDTAGPGGRVRILALGDLETGRQQALADRLRAGAEALGGPVDVVKVAHHGSSRQSPDLYALTGAHLGLIGVGADNDYGHPTAATLRMLAGLGIHAARTDLAGDLVVLRTREGLQVVGSR